MLFLCHIIITSNHLLEAPLRVEQRLARGLLTVTSEW